MAAIEAGKKLSQFDFADSANGAEMYGEQSAESVRIKVGEPGGLPYLDDEGKLPVEMLGFMQAGTGAAPRTVQAELREQVRVTQFGAVGDGVTNDATAFNNALNYIYTRGGGTVFVPAGTYRLGAGLRMGANTALVGEKGAKLVRAHTFSIIINGIGYDTSSVIPAYGGHGNIRLEGLILDLNPTEIADAGSHFGLGYAKNVVIRDCTFLDQYGNHYIDMSGCDGVLIEDCWFLGYDLTSKDPDTADAIQLDPNIEGSFPYFGLPSFAPCKNVTVRRCYFGDNPSNPNPNIGPPPVGVGSHSGIYDRWHENIVIEDCIFDGCSFAGVRALKWKNARVNRNIFIGGGSHVYTSGAAAGTESAKDINRVQTNKGQGNVGIRVSNNEFRDPTATCCFIVGFAVGDDAAAVHEGVTLDSNRFSVSNAAVECTQVRQTNNVRILNNEFVGGNTGANFNTNASFNIIIRGNSYRGQAGICIQFTATCTDIQVDGNRFGASSNRGIHVTSSAAKGIISNNLFDGTAMMAVNIQSSASEWLVQGNTVINSNSVADTDNTPIRVASTCVGVAVVDNHLASTLSVTAPVMHYGTGYASFTWGATPASVVAAPVGSRAFNTAGSTSTTLFVKTSGGGANTGWTGK